MGYTSLLWSAKGETGGASCCAVLNIILFLNMQQHTCVPSPSFKQSSGSCLFPCISIWLDFFFNTSVRAYTHTTCLWHKHIRYSPQWRGFNFVTFSLSTPEVVEDTQRGDFALCSASFVLHHHHKSALHPLPSRNDNFLPHLKKINK